MEIGELLDDRRDPNRDTPHRGSEMVIRLVILGLACFVAISGVWFGLVPAYEKLSHDIKTSLTSNQ